MSTVKKFNYASIIIASSLANEGYDSASAGTELIIGKAWCLKHSTVRKKSIFSLKRAEKIDFSWGKLTVLGEHTCTHTSALRGWKYALGEA